MSTTKLETGLLPLWSKKADTATPQFVPMTGPIDTTLVKDVRAARWLEAATPNLTTRVGYQMSDDGVTWSATVTGIGSWSATAGWVYNDDAAVAVTTDQRLFVRFGLLGANSSGTLIEQGLGRLSIDVRPVVGRTLAVEGAKVFTNGSALTTGRVFHPLVGPVPLEDIAEHRATVRIESSSGLLAAIPAFHLSDDGITWYDGAGGAGGTFGTFGTERTSEGTTYGTTFATATAVDGSKRRWVRYGVATRNNSGALNETALVSLRVDVRRTT